VAVEDVGDAAQLDADAGETARAEAFERLGAGRLEYLFVAPEQLARADTFDAVRRASPSVFVVDGAHCVSTWATTSAPTTSAWARSAAPDGSSGPTATP
jgi:ATP-dependent DNA helicase RecQ